MKRHPSAAAAPAGRPFVEFFSLFFGFLLGLTLMKFGNAVIMERYIPRPTNGWEWVLNPWPVSIAYWLLGFLVVILAAGARALRWRLSAPIWLVALPFVWLLWQFIAATHSVDAALTAATLRHFAACVVCFYIGHFVLSQARVMRLWAGIVVGLTGVIAVGLEQHFGGLEETRKYFHLYAEEMQNVPPEFAKRIESNRIWATLFYPNALAGVVLLLLPSTLIIIVRCFTRLTLGARQFVAAAFGAGGLACLYWSGSKGGWLLMLALVLIALLHLKFSQRMKIGLIAAIVVVGLAGFAVKYAGFFQRGATSVGARFDYWQAALKTAASNPLLGTGPGTFAVPYAKIKRPESEMSRMVHNDYLEQASDSGIPSFLFYSAFVVGVLVWSRPRNVSIETAVPFAIWLGVLGWVLQGLMEFGLYIPALGWTAFTLMGWLSAAGKPFDKAGQGK